MYILWNITKQAIITRIQNSRYINTKYREMKNIIDPLLPTLPQNIREGFEPHFDSIFHIIRITRNDAGHPKGARIRRDQMFSYLHLFVPYCQTIYELINWLSTNNI